MGLAAVFSLVGHSVVLVHRASGVLNFASAAVGMVGAYVYDDLWTKAQVGWPLAMLGGIATSAAIGGAIYLLVMRRLRNSAAISQIVATLGVMTTLIAVATLVFAPDGSTRAVASVLPTSLVYPFSGSPVGEDRLILFGISVALTLALMALQKYTRLGLALTAVHENPVVAASAGWSPDRVALAAWVLGSAISGAAIILVCPLSGLSVTGLTTLVIPAMAAALVGRFESFSMALLGALVIGVGESLVAFYISAQGWTEAAPLIVIIVVLVLRGTSLPDRSTTTMRLVKVGPGRYRPAGMAFTVVGILLVAFVSLDWLNSITTTFLLALVLVSVVVVTGYAGQISLAQMAIAGLGAYFTALFAIKAGLPVWLAIVCSVAVTVPIGVVISVNAVRVRGANLAVITLAVATVVEDLVLNNQWATAHLAGNPLPDLTVFGLDLAPIAHPRMFGFLALGALLAGTLVAANLRRGATGRRLLAVRANERAAAALGISVSANKLYAFAVATGVAAFAGALMEARFSFADFSVFQVLGSINATLAGVLGGLGWVSGAVLGATTGDGAVGAQVLTSFTSAATWLELIAGVSVIVIILQSADGLIALNLRQASALLARLRRGPANAASGGAASVEDTRPVDDAELARPACTVRLVGVGVKIGATVVLEDVDLDIRPGEVVGLIGPNGAGKSTLIDAVSGFQRLSSGQITVDGRSIGHDSVARRARDGISRSFQSLELFEDMTIRQNLQVASDRLTPRRYFTDLLWPKPTVLSAGTRLAVAEFRLAEVLDKYPAEIDFATRRLVAIARAMASSPTVLLLDEPAAGLDSTERGELAALIRRIAEVARIGVLLVEHDVDMVFGVCDRIVALDRGRVIAHGAPDELRTDERLIAVYLGEPDAEDEEFAVAGDQA